MSNKKEIHQALDAYEFKDDRYLNNKPILTHCISQYPAKEANISVLQGSYEEFYCDYGYSDHTEGYIASLGAVALGATIIEKHFTLDKNMTGCDQKASADPKEFREMVDKIRELEKMLGSGIKEPTKEEEKMKYYVRKSIHATRDIKEGEVLTEDDLVISRPMDGLHPKEWYNLIGSKAVRDFSKHEALEK
jgi:N,N'-diacetyllegionaminate synthase